MLAIFPGISGREKFEDFFFYKYGPIAHIELKIPPRPPGYAFVEFEEAHDAQDAVDGRDGYDFDVLITGLPNSASWQDLKDHMRKAGDVCFSSFSRGQCVRKLSKSPKKRSLSRSPSPRHSRSRSLSKSKSPVKGRSKSPVRGRSRSRSRSRSLSR